MATRVKLRPVPDQVNILGVGVDPVDMKSARSILLSQIRAANKGYICFVGVHGVMEAQRDPSLRTIFSKALLVAPDGMPTVWMGHLQGFSRMRRVFGPDFMTDIMGRKELQNCVHFLCGGGPGVAEHLREEMVRRFPWIQIAGTYTPPFREMTVAEEGDFIASIYALRPDIIWVGLSTPKQERFMARYLPMLDTKLMVGVGAAFLFHTGIIKDSPAWVKRAGLQWLHRLLQEPVRLGKRYMINNPLFIFYIISQLIGGKRYTLQPRSHYSR
jgi:N-acetylglucosaminyldiphosphoundecaprenol N-acetyl-beta-D-mannosaminyltransferase